MNVLILGSSGFIGKHLTRRLHDDGHQVTGFDRFRGELEEDSRLRYVEGSFDADTDFDRLLAGQEVVYHLISSSFPNSKIAYDQEISENVFVTLKLLEACVRQGIKRFVFISSGGTVYGEPIGTRSFKETDNTAPISSYGIQKLMIEKYLHLFYHQHQLDYKVIRLANPYGPGQNPKGQVGAIAVLLDRALKDQAITIFGDGTSVRDYIYIDDAIEGIVRIADAETEHSVFNLGSGQGTSLVTILEKIQKVTQKELDIRYEDRRAADLAYSVLDTDRYQQSFPEHALTDLEEGIMRFYHHLIQEEK